MEVQLAASTARLFNSSALSTRSPATSPAIERNDPLTAFNSGAPSTPPTTANTGSSRPGILRRLSVPSLIGGGSSNAAAHSSSSPTASNAQPALPPVPPPQSPRRSSRRPSTASGAFAMLRRSAGNRSNRADAQRAASTSNNNTTNSHHPPNALLPVNNATDANGATVSARDMAPSLSTNPAGAPTHAPRNPAPGTVHRIRLVPHLESSRSLPFEPIIRDAIENGPVLRVGRFTDRQTAIASAPNAPNALKVAFRSKVVSRGHAEIWVESNGQFLMKDTKSSSGTFLNGTRLSLANIESRPFPLKDGDIIQLGIDYQGGQQEIYRCVKIKVEIERDWQAAASAFNSNALERFRSFGVSNIVPSGTLLGPASSLPGALYPLTNGEPSSSSSDVSPNHATSHLSQQQGSHSHSHGTSVIRPIPASQADCCICLYPVTVCQALFVAPCSHAFHYKCMRPMLLANHPGFACPLCRTFADLESEVEVDVPEGYLKVAQDGSVRVVGVESVSKEEEIAFQAAQVQAHADAHVQRQLQQQQRELMSVDATNVVLVGGGEKTAAVPGTFSTADGKSNGDETPRQPQTLQPLNKQHPLANGQFENEGLEANAHVDGEVNAQGSGSGSGSNLASSNLVPSQSAAASIRSLPKEQHDAAIANAAATAAMYQRISNVVLDESSASDDEDEDGEEEDLVIVDPGHDVEIDDDDEEDDRDGDRDGEEFFESMDEGHSHGGTGMTIDHDGEEGIDGGSSSRNGADGGDAGINDATIVGKRKRRAA